MQPVGALHTFILTPTYTPMYKQGVLSRRKLEISFRNPAAVLLTHSDSLSLSLFL